MLNFFLVAHLTYENHWGKWHSKIRTFGFFGTPYSVVLKNISAHWKNSKDDRVEEQEATEGEGEKTEVEPSLREFTLTLSR